MPCLRSLRQQSLRAAPARVGLLLLVLALILTGMPRWELHSHAHGEPSADHAHDHDHERLMLDHQGPHPLDGELADAMQPHMHEASSMSASVCPIEPLILASPLPETWLSPLDRGRIHSNAGPPPHRPPIA